MTEEEKIAFFKRIDRLTVDHKPQFGKMNVSQVIPHCTDQFRMAFGTKKAKEYGKVDPNKILSMVKSGESVPSPKGFGQIEGEGTAPTDFETDKKILKEHISKFCQLDDSYTFYTHPYFGDLDKQGWMGLIKYHLNHHLTQFNV